MVDNRWKVRQVGVCFNGKFHGPATIHYPEGDVANCMFDDGKVVQQTDRISADMAFYDREGEFIRESVEDWSKFDSK